MAEYKLAAALDRSRDNEAYLAFRPPLDQERTAAVRSGGLLVAWEHDSTGESLFQLSPREKYTEQVLVEQLAKAAGILAANGDTAEIESSIYRSRSMPGDGAMFARF